MDYKRSMVIYAFYTLEYENQNVKITKGKNSKVLEIFDKKILKISSYHNMQSSLRKEHPRI